MTTTTDFSQYEYMYEWNRKISLWLQQLPFHLSFTASKAWMTMELLKLVLQKLLFGLKHAYLIKKSVSTMRKR